MADNMIGVVLAEVAAPSAAEDMFGRGLGWAIVVTTAYAAGRLHQWYRHAHERDDAWRAGYNLAMRSLFRYAVGIARSGREPASAVMSPLPTQRSDDTCDLGDVLPLRQPRHADTADDDTTAVIAAS